MNEKAEYRDENHQQIRKTQPVQERFLARNRLERYTPLQRLAKLGAILHGLCHSGIRQIKRQNIAIPEIESGARWYQYP